MGKGFLFGGWDVLSYWMGALHKPARVLNTTELHALKC